jgi:hypothetical protein
LEKAQSARSGSGGGRGRVRRELDAQVRAEALVQRSGDLSGRALVASGGAVGDEDGPRGRAAGAAAAGAAGVELAAGGSAGHGAEQERE